jgi:hypothetical protein
VKLYEDGLLFRYEGSSEGNDPAKSYLGVGTCLKLKFRQPRVVKDYYFGMSAQIVEVQAVPVAKSSPLVSTVRVRYDDLRPVDRALLKPFWDGPGTGGVFARLEPRPSEDSGHALPEPDTDDLT